MDKELARMSKASEEITQECEAAKAAVVSWEKRARVAEAQARKDREASDGIIQEQASKIKDLEEAAFRNCRGILGKSTPLLYRLLLCLATSHLPQTCSVWELMPLGGKEQWSA
jgi:hypothetical protein